MSKQRIGKKISDIYLSQEPALNTQRTEKTSKNTFTGNLKKVGFIVGDKNDPNELNVDQAVFLLEIAKLLSETNSSDLQNFIDGFESHLGDEIRLKWSLMPTITASTCETAGNVSQDSLTHLLLNLEIIQEKVIAIMLAKLVEISYSDNTALYDRSEGKTVACLIISQFRFLTKLVNSSELAEKLMELIEATPSDIQKDIIKLLPDVINEYDHSKVAKSLNSLFMSNQELNICILDTLTNFNIDQELLSEMREKVINTLSTTSIEDLPVLVKFVLQDVSVTEAPKLIQDLRDKIDFNSTFNPIISSTPIESSKGTDMSKSIESVVLSNIMHALRFQKVLCNAWIKHLELLQGSDNHKSFDIFVILILLSLGINEKKVEGLFKNKLRNTSINDDLLKLTFRCHHDVLQDYAHQMLKLAESMLRSSEPVISSFGSSIYVQCFVWFNTFFKQEIIGNLITHVGNRSENEINSALDTLLCLSRHHTSKVVSFALLIKSLLDHLDDLALNQVRKVHEMLSILGYQGGREGSMLLDDMFIIIRKQLTNKNIKYRKMGVIGALMAAKTAAEKEADEAVDRSISSDSLDVDQCYQNAIKLLELAANNTSESCEAYALFCDELSHVMLQKKLGQAILDWIGDNVLSDFEETYVIDVNSELYEGKSFGPKFTLDEVNEPVAIDLFTIVKQDLEGLSKSSKPLTKLPSIKTNGKPGMGKNRLWKAVVSSSNLQESNESTGVSSKLASPLKLAPMFRLLRIFRQIQDGNLDAIDALLGCAIVLPELKYPKFYVVSSNTKHLVLNTLFYCINWIRENINAFAVDPDSDIRGNVLSRLQLLIELEGLVCSYMGDVKGYSPPMANFDCEIKNLEALNLQPKKPVKRKAKGKNKKIKQSKTADNSIEDDDNSNDCSTKIKSSDSESEEDVSNIETEEFRDKVLKNIQPFFRELDLEVFVLLQSEITFKSKGDVFSNDNNKSRQLHVKELKFLLDDLSAKLRHSLNATATHLRGRQQHISFSKIESCDSLKVVTFCIQLISYLCTILRDFVTYFKTLLQEADGIEDSLSLFTSETQAIIKCMNLVFKVLKQIISWKGFILNENAILLQKALVAFVSGEESKSTSSKELINSCIEHLIHDSECFPSLSTAANLIELLSCILTYDADSDSKTKVSAIALRFLKNKWFDFESKTSKAAEMNAYVRIILEAYFQNSTSVLKALDFLSAEAVPQLLDKENEVVFHTLTKSSIGSYYKIMVTNLANYVKTFFSMRHSDEDQMYEWSVAFKVFQVLTNLLKCFGTRSNIGACIKASKDILQTFLRFGMPLMGKLFVDNKEDVVCLMKTLQISTRYLQHVCGHSKVLQDVTLIKQVPFLKKSLELFVYHVKGMLAVNKCEEAFWLGNLKNRDLKGEEILSQEIPDNDDDNSDEEEEQLQSDVDSSNVDSDSEIL